MKCLFIMCMAISIIQIQSKNIRTKVKEYFNSATTKTFERKWKPYGKMFENTIGSSLKEGFGHKSMNVYINRFQNPLMIANGYYHTDNQVKLILHNMFLEALPHLYDVEVTFPLSSNLLLLEASVSKMIVHTKYTLFRNEADIIYGAGDQDPYKNSPFRFQQVKNIGDLAITVEGCSLSGRIVVTLNGNSVNLGHQKLRLKKCQYNIEIYTLGNGAPPVIANYLPKGDKGLSIDTLLLRPLTEELLPKLQAAMFSELNTSAIFLKDLPRIRFKQAQLFEDTRSYIDEVVRGMNEEAIQNKMGTMTLHDFCIRWDDKFPDIPAAKSFKLSKMTLLGLDTLYASHTGGPVRFSKTEILEQLRFGTLQVTGSIHIEGVNDDDGDDFAVEISDFAFDTTINAAHKISFEALGWRFVEFSCPEIEFLPIESYVVGYLLKDLPQRLIRHLFSVYNDGNAFNNLKKKLNASTMEEQALDGKNAANTAEIISNENNTKLTIHQVDSNDYDVPVQLKQNVIVKPDEKENEKVNLPGQGSLEEHAAVKLNHVDAQHEQTNQEQVQLRQLVVKPHEDEHGIVKLNHDVTHPNKRIRNKLVKYFNASINKPMLKNIKLHKLPNSTKIPERNVQRTNTKSRGTTPHMSDNEIRSN